MVTLTFELFGSADPELTCFFCAKKGVDHEFRYRRDNSHGGREHVSVGVHLNCALDKAYGSGARERSWNPAHVQPGVQEWRKGKLDVKGLGLGPKGPVPLCNDCGAAEATDGGLFCHTCRARMARL